jgi:hypothetical protein
VPASVRQDYAEAADILERSPKAAATLARRALQGMLRDFHKVNVSGGRLFDEIAAVRSAVPEATWQALDAVRTLGNYGAHPERDISTIVEIQPGEAKAIVCLVEGLIEDWYVARHRRQENAAAVIGIASAKKADATKS